MSDSYSKELCENQHKDITRQLEIHEKRLNGHSARIDQLEQRGAAVDIKIENLCEQIKNLVSTLKWGIGIILTISLFVLGYLIKIS